MALTKIPSSLLDTSGGFDLQGNITLGDNEKIIFGDDTDLQLYHDGTHSYVRDTGTGNLRLQGTNLYLQNEGGTKNYLGAINSGAVTLYYNNDAKIATSSTGATVTGNLAVTGDLDITGDINSYNVTDLDVTDQTITLGAGQTEANSGGSGIIIDGSSASILWNETDNRFDINRDLDTGAGLFFGSQDFYLYRSDADKATLRVGDSGSYKYFQFTDTGTVTRFSSASGSVSLGSGSNDHLIINSSGNLFVGGLSSTSKPTGLNKAIYLQSQTDNDVIGYSLYTNEGTNNRRASFFLDDANGVYGFDASASSGVPQFVINSVGTERMRIDASGKLLIGDSASHVDDLLQIETPASGGGHGIQIRRNDSNGDQGIGRIMFGNNNDTDLATVSAITDGQADSARLVFSTQPTSGLSTERMRIDSNGNLFLNTTSAMDNCFVQFTDHSNGEAFLGLSSKDDNNVGIRFGVGTTRKWINYRDTSNNLVWYDNAGAAERMRINATGQLLVGTSTNPTYNHKCVVSGNACVDGVLRVEDVDASIALSNVVLGLSFPNDSDATTGYFIYMADGNGAIGSISVASGTSVSFNTTSDERLKKNIVNASPQLDMIKSVKVREFDWKRNDHHELGLIAQEIKDIIPNVVSEGGDDETKNPYGVDYGKLTPYLIKAMQEQQTIIDDLKSRIETLEG